MRVEFTERFFAATGAAIAHGGTMAFYQPATDSIRMRPFDLFRDAESYYATPAHEVARWTGHASRLARDLGGSRFGTGVCGGGTGRELGAAFLCADLGLALEPRE